MKHTLRQVFRSGKFLVGFSIFVTLLLIVIIYPLIVPHPPLAIIAEGTFFPPGIYVSTFDAVNASATYTLHLPDADARRIANRLSMEDRQAMKEWLVAVGIPAAEIDIADTAKLLAQWEKAYDPKAKIEGMTIAKRNYYARLDQSLKGLLSTKEIIIAAPNPTTGALVQTNTINRSTYVNVGQVANVRLLPLGTDNFGRDVLTELVKATAVSLQIGFVAGLIATLSA